MLIQRKFRRHVYVLIILLTAFVFSCSNKKTTVIAQVPRDTTITPSVAYTRLTLDSAAVAQFIRSQVGDKELGVRVCNFYNRRNFQYAWFDEQGLTEQGEAFWNLHQMQAVEDHDSSVSAKRLHRNMQLLLNEDTTILSSMDLQNTEMDLTLHFFKYINTALSSKVQPEQMEWHIPMRKINAQAALDSFLTGHEKDWKPLNQSFYKLQSKIEAYVAIDREGGWLPIKPPKAVIKEGATDSLVGQVKKRLSMSGDFDSADTTNVFDASLQAVIKKLQHSFGLTESGAIDAALIKQLNVPIENRLRQMKINLERMRWMPLIGDGVFVNIPEFRLHVFQNKSEVLNMNIVAGKAANRTVIFSDQMEYIIFSPYWNVPPSIVRKEILPALHRSGGYLSRNNMEVTGYLNGLPVIRQRPGADNALGGVKFVFPNRYNIYLHDTPAKSLFSNEKRAFSHGCIRIQKPFELAKYLLRNEKQWTDEKIRAAMHQDHEQLVRLPKPVPVFVVYFTSWVDSDGVLNFRDDVYGHDARMASHLFGK